MVEEEGDGGWSLFMLLGGRRQDLWVGEILNFFGRQVGGVGGLAVGFRVVLVGSCNVVLVMCCVNEKMGGLG